MHVDIVSVKARQFINNGSQFYHQQTSGSCIFDLQSCFTFLAIFCFAIMLEYYVKYVMEDARIYKNSPVLCLKPVT